MESKTAQVESADTNASKSDHVNSSTEDIRSTSQPTLAGTIQQSYKILGYCLALTAGILLYGYDLVIVNNVSSMPQFQRDYGRELKGQLITPSVWLSLWSVAGPIGGLFGAIAGGVVQDRVGRRLSLAIASFISAVAVAVLYVSNLPTEINDRRAIFLVAKLVQGFAVYMVVCTAETYMSEVLPTMLRGPTLALFPIFTLVGQFVGSVVVRNALHTPGARGYLNCFLSQWPFSALSLLVSVLVPESPTYLIRKSRLDEALKAQRRLDTAKVDSLAKIQQLRASAQLAEQESAGYRECFVGVNRRRTIIVLFVNMIPNLLGITLLAKASYFLQIIGMSANKSIMMLQVIIGLGLAANIFSFWTLSRFGRVPLIIISLSIIAFLWLGMGISGCFDGTVNVWYSAVTFCLVVVASGTGAWPATYAVGAETSSLRLRAKTQGLGWFVNCLSTGVAGLVLPYIFNPDQGALISKTGFLFFASCVVAAVVTWFIVPEMKARTPAEIDRMFENRLPTKEFRRWSPEMDEVTVTLGA
ncbi:proton myo-inositol cotransporter [Aspergillus homomorphus CBS 101889]|uniref:Proton myo-inositol cotransporter n=1 Tax=Aspergillus homomorphus (strain CBS 101889) TaxID=1450537 RepID=A0A395I183_ASPHC|nr:proton myo-inositol cotransporter [Aspergillus homomorphus CBS 101889]RAL12918.1 proton myo-inositol cotransporter [Aspergillus homomorphus CBS 101889]